MKNPVMIFKIGLRQVLRDGMLLILLPAPFLMGAVLRVLVPLADQMLNERMGFSISPWFSVSDAMVLTMTPVMTAMISAFLILEERDEGIGTYYNITPASGYSYLTARIGLPMIWGWTSSILVISLFSINQYGWFEIVVATVIGTLQGVIMSMFLVAFAANKVEGLALAKLSNIFVMGFVIPWLIPWPFKYLFGVLPGFWIGEILKNTNLTILTISLYGLGGLISCLVFILLLTKIFLKRIT